MLGIVERNPVQKKQVLVRPASAHIYSRKALGTALHSRHQLDCLQNIGLTEEHRGVLDHIHRNLDRAHLRGHDSGFPLRRDDRLLQLAVRLQRDIDRSVTEQVKREGDIVVAHVGVLQADSFPLRDRQCVEAVGVGGGSRAVRDDPGSDQSLSRGLVGDVAAHRDPGSWGLCVQTARGTYGKCRRIGDYGFDQMVMVSHTLSIKSLFIFSNP